MLLIRRQHLEKVTVSIHSLKGLVLVMMSTPQDSKSGRLLKKNLSQIATRNLALYSQKKTLCINIHMKYSMKNLKNFVATAIMKTWQ